MQVTKTERGFELLREEGYPTEKSSGIHRLAQQSSAIGDYDGCGDLPGSSYLWIGEHHHLNREEVSQLVKHLQAWLATGSLEIGRK